MSDGEQRCAICLKVFKQRRSLQVHLTIHSGARPYACCRCNKRFRLLTTLRDHEKRIHEQRLAHQCGFCVRRFFTSMEAKKHETRAHLRDFRFFCKVCGAKFVVRGELNWHARRAHGSARQCLECAVCKRTFVSQMTLMNHWIAFPACAATDQEIDAAI